MIYDSLDYGKENEPKQTHMQGAAYMKRKRPQEDSERNAGTHGEGCKGDPWCWQCAGGWITAKRIAHSSAVVISKAGTDKL